MNEHENKPEEPNSESQNPSQGTPREEQNSQPGSYQAAPGSIVGDDNQPVDEAPSQGETSGPSPSSEPPRNNYPPPPASPQGPQPQAPQRPPQAPPQMGPAPQQQQQGPPPRGPYGPPQGNYGQPGYPPQRPAPPYGYGQAPPGGPRGPKRRNRVLPIIIGLVILGFFLISGLVAIVAGTSGSASSSGIGLYGSKIGVLEIEGVLGEGPAYGADTKRLIEQVKAWTKNENIKAMVIRINSPGGAVAATQELYDALLEFRQSGTEGKPRPIVASMGDVAASGGYYAALAADEIYANDGTLTGSVGVIMSFYDYQGLQDKIGLDSRVVKSGEFKDMGSGSRDWTEAERALFDEMVVDVFEQFFDEVSASRSNAVREHLNPAKPEDVSMEEVRAHLKQYCDGRIFSGRQAFSYAMIDQVGTMDDAVERAAAMANIDPDTTKIRGPKKPTGLFGMESLASEVKKAMPKAHGPGVKLEYRLPF